MKKRKITKSNKICESPLQNARLYSIICNWHILALRDAAVPYVHEEVKV